MPAFRINCVSFKKDVFFLFTRDKKRLKIMFQGKLYRDKNESNNTIKEFDLKPAKKLHYNDYTNHYIHTNSLPQKHVTNAKSPNDGYPKLQKLVQKKEEQIREFATTPFGCKVDIDQMIPTLNKWVHQDNLTFDVVMIGCLTDKQFIYPLLAQLPLDKLISKPGFLFIWASAHKINELAKLLNSETWAKRFRRSEELVFVPVDKNSPFYPELDQDDETLVEKMQWHCWMCITGTVRRSTDGHLIHCNVDIDISIETEETRRGAVPSELYKVAENFSTATRRLHIIPARTGYNTPVRARPGWVIMSPDIMLDNFSPNRYKNQITKLGYNLPPSEEIESLRPRTPVTKA